MDGFALLLAHLLGDYVLQNDWQASNKTNGWHVELGIREPAMMRAWWRGNVACTVHCCLYTLAVAALSWWWMPWWGLVVCFLVHWPVDRFRLARVWMEKVSGQKAFATGPLAPWSIIIVDNVFHLLTLYLIWVAHRITA